MLNKEFLAEKFGTEHEQAFPGDKLYDGGWPDMGNGRYTMAAGYKAWMEINKGQRVYLNYNEQIQQITACMMIAGLVLPITTAVWGGIYVLCRLGYVCAYMSAPKRRFLFVPPIMFTQVMMPLFAIVCMVVLYTNKPIEGE